MEIENLELFAASVVQSSGTDLSVVEKLELYVQAMELAKKYNETNKDKNSSISDWLF